MNFNRPAKTPKALPEIFTLLSHTVRGKAGERRGLRPESWEKKKKCKVESR